MAEITVDTIRRAVEKLNRNQVLSAMIAFNFNGVCYIAGQKETGWTISRADGEPVTEDEAGLLVEVFGEP